MTKKLFLFITPDGVTHSSADKIYPDVDNFQVLGESEGIDEEEAFRLFVEKNKWLLDTDFKEIICIETKTRISQGKIFILKNNNARNNDKN